MHNKPVLDPSFPLLVTHSRWLREVESPKNPTKKHTHLYQSQVLPRANRWPVREREIRRWVVLSSRRTRAEPSFGKECIWRVEVSRVTVNAVRVKRDLCLFRNDPTKWVCPVMSDPRVGIHRMLSLQISKHSCAFTLSHGALRPAWDCRLKTKRLVAVRNRKS